jgi:hypothetical protein
MAHAAEPSATGPDQRFQHRLDTVAEGEIGEAQVPAATRVGP